MITIIQEKTATGQNIYVIREMSHYNQGIRGLESQVGTVKALEPEHDSQGFIARASICAMRMLMIIKGNSHLFFLSMSIAD
jgi:hypothetical protein